MNLMSNISIATSKVVKHLGKTEDAKITDLKCDKAVVQI